MRVGSLPLALAFAGLLTSCVEPNHGSRIVIDLYRGFGPASQVQGAGTLAHPHYELWATLREDSVARLLPFSVAPIVDPTSPCLYYDSDAARALGGEVQTGELVMAPPASTDSPAAQADKAWLQQRASKLSQSVLAISSASDGFDGHTVLDLSLCQGQTCWLDHAELVAGTLHVRRNGQPMQELPLSDTPPPVGGFCTEYSTGRLLFNPSDMAGTIMVDYRAHIISPRPQTDPATWSNVERLAACTAPRNPGPGYDPDFYIGNLVELMASHGGRIYGVVDTMDPDAQFQLGGAEIPLPFALDQMTELFVTVEDRNIGSPSPDLGDLVDPARRGPVVVHGPAVADAQSGRGVVTVELVAPGAISIGGLTPGGHASIYTRLDESSPF